MNISKEQTGDLGAVVTIHMKPEDYQPRVEKAIREQAKKAKIPGFRPGMVPPSHIKKMYGKSILVDEVNHLLSDTLSNYIQEEKLEVLGQPLPKADNAREYNWDFSDDFEFNYELGLAPAFDLGFSAADKVVQYIIKADAETLEQRKGNLRRAYGKMTNPDVSAENDVLYAELVQLSPDGSVFEGGIVNTASVRLEHVRDEEIRQSLIGRKAGDELVLDVQKAYNGDAARIAGILKIDEDLAADLKSKFRLSVKNVNRLEASELNQEFFDKVFGEGIVTSEAEFTEKVREEIEQMFLQDSERKLQNDLYELSLRKADFDLPDDFLKRWLKATNEKLTDEELSAGYADFARSLKWTLIENKIIREQQIEFAYEEVFHAAKQHLDAQFRMYSPQPLSEEQLAQYTVQFLQNKEQANKIIEEVKASKVFDYLKGVVTLEKKEITAPEFAELSK